MANRGFVVDVEEAMADDKILMAENRPAEEEEDRSMVVVVVESKKFRVVLQSVDFDGIVLLVFVFVVVVVSL